MHGRCSERGLCATRFSSECWKLSGNPTKPRDDCVIQNEAQTHEYQRTSEKGWRGARCEDAWRRDSGLACGLALVDDRENFKREIKRALEFGSRQLNREFSADGTVVVRDGRMSRACVLGLSGRVLASRPRKSPVLRSCGLLLATS